ncbi:MAG: hypothetical protein RhofKO_11390 [Rhodothermales bacterium]
MHVFLDHIMATLIGCSVVVILLYTQFRANETAVEQLQYLGAKQQMLSMNEWIEEDLLNIGVGVTGGLADIAVWNDSTFTFRRKIDAADAAASLITYSRSTVGSIAKTDSTYTVYKMTRAINGVVDGGTPENMSLNEFIMLDAAGNQVFDPSTAVSISVRLHILYSENSSILGETRYVRRFWPADLN